MKILLSIAAAAAALGAAPALARDSAPTPRSQIVRYSDLNLSSVAGRQTLDRRIAVAVRQVCGQASDADIRGKNAVHRCRADTAKSVAARREAALASATSGASTRLASGQ
jgi:UrcA family protein